MSDVETHLALEGGDLVVRRSLDAQDIADRAKMLAEQPQHGADFHHKWSLPVTIVEQFYQEYCGLDRHGVAHGIDRPMDQEFWIWVHQKMKDPQYKVFWTYDPANPGWLGYGPR